MVQTSLNIQVSTPIVKIFSGILQKYFHEKKKKCKFVISITNNFEKRIKAK